MAKKASKNARTSAQSAEQSALQNRPTKHFCKSPKCPTPGEPILLKDLQPAGEPRKPMSMFHKSCYRAL